MDENDKSEQNRTKKNRLCGMHTGEFVKLEESILTRFLQNGPLSKRKSFRHPAHGKISMNFACTAVTRKCSLQLSRVFEIHLASKPSGQ